MTKAVEPQGEKKRVKTCHHSKTLTGQDNLDNLPKIQGVCPSPKSHHPKQISASKLRPRAPPAPLYQHSQAPILGAVGDTICRLRRVIPVIRRRRFCTTMAVGQSVMDALFISSGWFDRNDDGIKILRAGVLLYSGY
jgi:hypothetical protein